MQKQIKTSMGGLCEYLEITDCTFPFCLQDFPLSHRELICLVMGNTSDYCTGNCDVHIWSVSAPLETTRRYGRLFPRVFCWIARNVPFPKSHNTSFCCFGNIITLLCYKQSKKTQLHSSGLADLAGLAGVCMAKG